MTITTNFGSPLFTAELAIEPPNYYTVRVRHENGHTASTETDETGQATVVVPVGIVTFYVLAEDPHGVSCRTAWLTY